MPEDKDEKIYQYKEGPTPITETPPPKDQGEAVIKGREYYEKWLKPVLPGLKTIVESLQQESGTKNGETACVFLDRDARPAMHAWKALTGPEYSTLSLPVTGVIFRSFTDHQRNFEDLNLGDIQNPDEWSTRLKEDLDTWLPIYPEVQKWIDSFRQSHEKRLADKKLVVVVDIGYRGSAVEVARFLLQRAFPDKKVKSVLLYKHSENIPIRSVVTGETTWYAEFAIPHTTAGYGLDLVKNKYRHIKIKDLHRIWTETNFYRGVIEAAKNNKEDFDGKNGKAIEENVGV